MPRYRYKKVILASRKLRVPSIELRRVGDGIAILETLGEGTLTLETAPIRCYGETREVVVFYPELGVEHLRGKNAEAVWWMFDSATDVEQARRRKFPGRQADPSACGRWVLCPHDVLSVLDTLPPEGILRLRHFAALMLLNITITQNVHFAVRRAERAAVDARLTTTERTVAFAADRNAGLRNLLWLR